MSSSKFIRSRIIDGEAFVGTFVTVPHPSVLELAAKSGFDFIALDAEHSPIDRAGIDELVRAADSVNSPIIVRVPDETWIASALDSGASGVLMPLVNTAEQAKKIVSEARYPPLGVRGVGAPRATGYGHDIMGYVAKANENVTVAIMIETLEALSNIEEIVAVEGIDIVYIGPGDLGLDINTSSGNVPTMEEAIETIIASCKKANKPFGIFAGSGEDCDKWLEKGATFITLGCDVLVFCEAYKTLRESANN